MDARKREEFMRGQRNRHGPAFRSQAAQHLTGLGRRSFSQTWDTLTVDAAKYYVLRSSDADVGQRAAEFPMIEAACALQVDPVKAAAAKLLVLVDSPVSEIAARISIVVGTVAAWEQLYFDIRPLLGALDWLDVQVIEAERKAGNAALAARMKLAVTAGAVAVQAVLEMDQGLPLDAAERLYQRMLKWHLKFDEAVEMPIDDERNRLKFIRIYTEMQIAKQRLDYAGQQLAARCAKARDAHELAKMREAHRQQRIERQENDKQRRRGQTGPPAAAAGVTESQQEFCQPQKPADEEAA